MTKETRDQNQPAAVATHSPAAIPFWIQAVVIVGAMLFTMGSSLAMLNPGMMLAHGEPITPGVLVYARYLVSRNLAVALFLIIPLLLRARKQLSLVILLAGCVQLFDAVLDVQEGRWILVPGISILALLFLFTAARLSGFPFWKAGAWKTSSPSDFPSPRMQ
jgi:hypothetical protein